MAQIKIKRHTTEDTERNFENKVGLRNETQQNKWNRWVILGFIP